MPTLIYLLTLPLLFIDAYRSNSTVLKLLHIGSQPIALWAIVLLILLRLFFRQIENPLLKKINSCIFPITFILGSILAILEVLTPPPPNYVFSLTHIQYTQLVLISVFSGIVWLLNHPDEWFKKYYQQIIFLGATAYLIVAYIASLFPFDIFIKLSQEDRLVEYTQVIALLLGAVFAINLARQLFQKAMKLHAVIFVLVAIVLFLVAGDEVSWGQRIFHIATPENIAVNNAQEEITFHNLYSVGGFVQPGYILIGLYGSTAWVLPKLLPRFRKSPFTYYIPPWFCSPYFFLGFLYNAYVSGHPYHHIGMWSESAELMLYTGIMFTLFSFAFKQNGNLLELLRFKNLKSL